MIRILHLEDDPLDAELARAMLIEDGLSGEVVRVDTRAEFEAALDQGRFDVILSDHALPAFDGIRALALAQRKRPGVPFIFVSGAMGEEAAIDSLRHGATDYVLKSRLARLGPAVRRALQEAEARAERERAEAALRESEERYRRVVEHSHDLIAALDTRGRVLYVSPSYEMALGYPVEAWIGADALGFVHPDDWPRARAELERALAGEVGALPEVRLRHRDGGWRYVEGTIAPVRDESGRPVMLVATSHDISGRKQAEEERERLLARERAARQRFEFLAGASRALAASLDVETTLSNVVQLAVPHLADLCAVHVLREDGTVDLLALARAGGSDGRPAREIRRRLPVDLDAEHGVGRVLRTGQSELHAALPDSILRALIPEDESLEAARAAGERPGMTVPLAARGHTLGTISFVAAESGRRYAEDDLIVAEELARRAALAVDNARLYEAEREARARAEAEIAERRRAEEQLRKLSRAVEHSANAIIITDTAGAIEYVNPKFTEVTGYTREEVLGRNPRILKSGETSQEGYRRLWETITAGKPWHGVLHNKKKNGELYWEANSIAPVVDAEGAVTHFVAVKEDITAQRRAEEEIRRLNQDLDRRVAELQTLLDILPVGISVAHDARGKDMSINPAGARMLGIPAEANPSKSAPHGEAQPFRVLRNGVEVPPDELPMQYAAAHDTAIRDAEYEIVHAGGAVVNLLEYASPLHDEQGRVRGSLGVFVDITERKRAEAALAAEKERLAVTLRSIGDGVIATDTGGRVVLLNPVAEALTGWSQAEAAGHPITEVFHIVHERTRERQEDPVAEVFRTGGAALANHTVLVALDGVERVIADSAAPIRDRDGRVLGAVLVFRDITEKEKLDEELAKASKLESIGVLAGGIAHDFNNILTAILANLSLAKLYVHPTDKPFDRLVEAEKASLRAKDLTQQLLTFAKGGAPIRKLVTLGGLLKDSVSFALAGTNVRAEFGIPDNLWPAEVDEGQIGQVIQNLVLNAQQAMPQGGIVRVEAENIMVRLEQGLPLPDGPYVKISVVDHGRGIPEQHLPKIFDPFFTTKEKGSGLGLATAYAIVQKHEGHVTVDSRPDEGTTFSVYLPASPGEASRATPVRPRALAGGGRILVMDDDEAMRETMSEVMGAMGYEVETTADGAEAVRLYRQALGTDRPFDAVILDLTVPGGMGGLEAIRRLRRLHSGVKAIVSSGYSSDPVMADFRAYGFSGMVTKPYTVEELSEAVHAVLAGA